jgi:hypothetical protein
METKKLKKGPFTDAWFKKLDFVIRQGSTLGALPFSFDQSSKSLFITYRGELKSKCFMTFFTCWILIYSSNYIYKIHFRSKDDEMDSYEFCFCITLVDLIIYVLALAIFSDVHQFCHQFNALMEYGREFNCKL